MLENAKEVAQENEVAGFKKVHPPQRGNKIRRSSPRVVFLLFFAFRGDHLASSTDEKIVSTSCSCLPK